MANKQVRLFAGQKYGNFLNRSGGKSGYIYGMSAPASRELRREKVLGTLSGINSLLDVETIKHE